jgi:hypothetical protein
VATLWTHLGSATGERTDIACISHDPGLAVVENALTLVNVSERDWVSINRGEVIDVEHLTGQG